MVSTLRNLLCLVILTVLVSTGYAINCYNCDTILHSHCGQNFKANESYLADCSNVAPYPNLSQDVKVGNATGCMKYTVEIYPGRLEILRTCYFGDVRNKQGCPLDHYMEGFDCDVCTKDGCNGSASQAPFAGAIILFFGVLSLKFLAFSI